MITRLFASALLVAGLSQAALAQSSMQQNQPSTSAENAQAPQNLSQSLRQRLTSAGFSDVNIVPRSLFITARDQSGRPVMMRVTPNSMFLVTEMPTVGSSTPAARGESNASIQQNQPSTSAENTQAPQTLSHPLQQRLTSAGFSDVNIVPGSQVITARDQSGRPVMMRITPNSMFFLTEIPAVSPSTTGAAGRESGESNDFGQSK